ncbi:MAG: apolipoprotein N-acyltransferase, partial [Gammaproteobacteria bacterium]
MTKPSSSPNSAAVSARSSSPPLVGARHERLALRAGLALVAGAIHAAAFAPLNLWWLQPIALAVLLYLACGWPPARSARRQAALVGLSFGFGWFVTGVAWLFVSMHRYGGMPAPMAAAALVLFALYLGAFCGASLALAQPALARAFHDLSARATLHAALLFAACWGGGEMLRGYLFTGFPWLSSGYAHGDGPLAALAPVAGVYGIGALAASMAAGLALAAARRRSVASGAFLGALGCVGVPLALAVALAPVHWAEDTGETLEVRLLQGNVPQQMKFDPERSLAAMQAYARAIRAA